MNEIACKFPKCGLAAHATGVERTAQPHTTHSSSTGVEGPKSFFPKCGTQIIFFKRNSSKTPAGRRRRQGRRVRGRSCAAKAGGDARQSQTAGKGGRSAALLQEQQTTGVLHRQHLLPGVSDICRERFVEIIPSENKISRKRGRGSWKKSGELADVEAFLSARKFSWSYSGTTNGTRCSKNTTGADTQGFLHIPTERDCL